MSNTLNLGDGKWAAKEGSLLAYNSENGNYKPLPFNFSRASSATVINKDGLIETVGSGQPRIDYKDDSKGAMLLEPSRSNLVTYSEDFSQSFWTKYKTTLQSNQVISPDGTQNADTLFETSTTFSHTIYSAISSSADTEYNFSIFVKKLNRRYVGIQGFYSASRGNIAFFDLDNGTLEYTSSEGTGFSISDAKIEEYSNEWYRLSANFTAPDTTIYMGLCLADERWTSGNSHDNLYIGDTSKGVYIYGAQLEQGSYATSYIPTQGSAVTRLAESCLQENLLTDIINASYPFTMYVDGKYNGQVSPLLSFLNIDASQQYFFIYIFNNEVIFAARSNGTTEKIESNINLVDGQEYKIAVTMESSTNGKICVNGNSVTVKNNFSSQIQNSNITDLLIGQERVVSDSGLRSSVSGVKFYNTALTDAELIALTS